VIFRKPAKRAPFCPSLGERRASDQQHDLNVLGHHHRLQAAKRRVREGEHGQHDDRREHGDAEKALKDLGGREQADADVNQQRAHEPDEGEKRARLRAIASLHELRERPDAGADVERRKNQGEQREREAGHPLEVADHQAILRAAGREPHEMDG
jgi:hypothetical protein